MTPLFYIVSPTARPVRRGVEESVAGRGGSRALRPLLGGLRGYPCTGSGCRRRGERCFESPSRRPQVGVAARVLPYSLFVWVPSLLSEHLSGPDVFVSTPSPSPDFFGVFLPWFSGSVSGSPPSTSLCPPGVSTRAPFLSLGPVFCVSAPATCDRTLWVRLCCRAGRLRRGV